MKRLSLVLFSAALLTSAAILAVWLGFGSQQNASAAAAAPGLVVMTRSYASPPNTPVNARAATHIESAAAGRWTAMARHYASVWTLRTAQASSGRWEAMARHSFAPARASAERWTALARRDAYTQAGASREVVMTRHYAPARASRPEQAAAERWNGIAARYNAPSLASAERWSALARHAASTQAGASREVAMTRSYAPTQVSRAELAAAERLNAMNSQYIASQTEAARWNALARHDAASQAQVFNIIPVTGGSGGSASDAVLPVQEMAALNAAEASAYHWNLMVRYYTNQP